MSPQEKNQPSHKPAVQPKPSSSELSEREKQFGKSVDHAKGVVKGGEDSLKELFESGRNLAEAYLRAKRVDVEKYAMESLQSAQQNLAKSIDSSLGEVSAAVERALDRTRVYLNRFIGDVGHAIQSGLDRIDERPAVPLIAAFVAGGLLGVYIGNRVMEPRQARRRLSHSASSEEARGVA